MCVELCRTHNKIIIFRYNILNGKIGGYLQRLFKVGVDLKYVNINRILDKNLTFEDIHF